MKLPGDFLGLAFMWNTLKTLTYILFGNTEVIESDANKFFANVSPDLARGIWVLALGDYK